MQNFNCIQSVQKDAHAPTGFFQPWTCLRREFVRNLPKNVKYA